MKAAPEYAAVIPVACLSHLAMPCHSCNIRHMIQKNDNPRKAGNSRPNRAAAGKSAKTDFPVAAEQFLSDH